MQLKLGGFMGKQSIGRLKLSNGSIVVYDPQETHLRNVHRFLCQQENPVVAAFKNSFENIAKVDRRSPDFDDLREMGIIE